jgi:cytochrome c peroxidase
MNRRHVIALAACLLSGGVAIAATAQQAVLDHYATLARRESPQFTGFSAARGRAFFLAVPGTGEPGTPSCSTCHTKDPRNAGLTRAGKSLEPMAVSLTPTRFSDLAKVEKWFSRNCQTVYGRLCTAVEKGDFIAYMASQ